MQGNPGMCTLKDQHKGRKAFWLLTLTLLPLIACMPRKGIQPRELLTLPPQPPRFLENITLPVAASLHRIEIRTREPRHLHREHEIYGVLISGEGVLWLGTTWIPLKPGDPFTIPKNTPHAFICTGREPAHAWVLFVPPWDGKDRVPLPETLEREEEPGN